MVSENIIQMKWTVNPVNDKNYQIFFHEPHQLDESQFVNRKKNHVFTEIGHE